MSKKDMEHLKYLGIIAGEDVRRVKEKEKTYGGSWKKRGGAGAFIVMARKWDRLHYMLKKQKPKWNIFKNPGDGSDDSVIAQVRDLRSYLLLIEAELMACHKVPSPNMHDMWFTEESKPGTPDDGGHHEVQVTYDEE